jgi:PAS domain S-box-containing protein
MPDKELIKRRLEREISARRQAESILEQKALELYRANEDLRKLNDDLEQRVQERTLELRLSEEKYRGIIENMNLGILEVDNEERIVRAYSRFSQLTGYEPDELLGKVASDILAPIEEQRSIIHKQNDKRKTGDSGVYEVQMRRKNGEALLAYILILQSAKN